jgi:hypothetical protein
MWLIRYNEKTVHLKEDMIYIIPAKEEVHYELFRSGFSQKLLYSNYYKP